MSKSKVLKEEQVSNHPQAIASVIAGLKEELSMSNDSFIICAEHTGQYTYPLCVPVIRWDASCGLKIPLR